MRVVTITLVALFFPLHSAAAMEIYKWRDEKGVTHYSDKKPAGVKWQHMPETGISVIPGERIGAEAARAERNARAAQPVAAGRTPEQTALQERRDQLLQECHVNNGVDCEREVDTQLRAERIQQGAPVIHVAPRPPTSVTR
jgi:hypothetical protein